MLRYSSVLGPGGALSLDLNWMARQPLFGTARMSSYPIGDIRADGVLVLDTHEIIAGKIVALFSRNAGRDLFDARRILAVDGLDWNRIKAAVLALGACGIRDWRTASIDSMAADPREICQNLAVCLPSDRFAALSDANRWIEEIVPLCRKNYGFLFNLSRNERKFLDGVLDHGVVDANLLDVDPEIRTRIGSMPMSAGRLSMFASIARTGE